MSPSRARLGLALALATSVAAFLWLTHQSLHNGFTVDDPRLLYQQCMRPSALKHVWSSPFFVSDLYRPITAATLCVDFERAGHDPTPFHATNALLMLGAAAALGFFVRRLVGGGPVGPLAAALYLVFPGNVRSTSWIYARGEHLFLLFTFAALAVFLRSIDEGDRRRLALAALLFFGALLSKEVAFLTLPAAALLAVVRGRAAPVREQLLRAAALGVPAAIYLALRHALGIGIRTPRKLFPAELGTELLTVVTGLPVRELRGGMHLRLVWSENGALAHSQQWYVPVVAAGLLLAAALALLLRRSDRPDVGQTRGVLAFCVAWWLGTSLPVLVGGLHEHYTMAPAAAWALLLALALSRLDVTWRTAAAASLIAYWTFLSSWRLEMSRAQSLSEAYLTRRITAGLDDPDRSVVVFARFPVGMPGPSLFSPSDSLAFALGRPVHRVIYLPDWPARPETGSRTALARLLGRVLPGSGSGPWTVLVHRYDESRIDVTTERFDARREAGAIELASESSRP